MSVRTFAVLLTCTAALTACRDSTSSDLVTVLTPDIGPTLTFAGPSLLGGAGISRLRDAVEGASPLAIVASQIGELTGERACVTDPVTFRQTCTLPFGTISAGFTLGGRDSLGSRTEVTVSGTVPKTPVFPALLVARKASYWILSSGLPQDSRSRYRSIETGTASVVGDPSRTTTDTGTVDVVFLGGFPSTDILFSTPAPRLFGTSRRVVWTRAPGQPASFWRETSTYDSTRLIKTVIETPAGTKRCTIDSWVFAKLALVCE